MVSSQEESLEAHEDAVSVRLRLLGLLPTRTTVARPFQWPCPKPCFRMVVDPMRTWGRDFAVKWRRFWRRLVDDDWDRLGYRAPRCTWAASMEFHGILRPPTLRSAIWVIT